MQTINSKQRDDLTEMQKSNPSVENLKPLGDRQRIAMTTPLRKLETNELPGFHMQWLRGTRERIQQALNAGFEFVSPDEVGLNNLDLGGDAAHGGNTDMGSRVSTGEGGGELGLDGQPIRLYLMKQRKEYHDEDKAILQRRNDSVVDSLMSQYKTGAVGEGAENAPSETTQDRSTRYVGTQTKIPEIFRRKPDRS